MKEKTNNAVMPVVDFNNVKHIDATDLVSTGRRGGIGGMSLNLVWSEENGKRVKFSHSLHKRLESPETIQVVKNGDNLIMGREIPGATETFKFSKGKGTTIIYSGSFVKWIIDNFNLDFSKCVSKSFQKIRIESQNFEGSEITYAIVDMG